MPADINFLGLLELDATGTVLYSEHEKDGDPIATPPVVLGSNFFTEVAGFENVEDFRCRLDSFAKSGSPAGRFGFTCDFENGPVSIRVLLARISERADNRRTKSILIHIKRA